MRRRPAGVRPRRAAHRITALEQQVAEQAETIARLEQAKAAAEAANEAKTRFLASVSHEIRSPLNAIYGYAQLLERDGGDSAQRAARVIRRSSEHLSNLVEGLLDIAQVESGSLRLSRDPVRFAPFLEQLVEMFAPQAAAKGIALELERPPHLPEFVRTDAKRLRQVLINLITNAIKFTDAGRVVLRLHYRNELATFEVEDTGPGIAADDLARIFEPFARTEAAEREGRPGIGLGLAITQALVRIMGGEITATSTPGSGTRFAVRLMLSQPLERPANVPEDGPIATYEGPRRTILLIDDDVAHLEVLRGLLAPLGFEVLSASDSDRGLALAGTARPDLVLLDVSMPGRTGWETAALLRSRLGPAARIVMLSGETDTAPPEGDMPAANDLFLRKPFEFAVLLDAIADQLALRWTGPGAQPAAPAPPAAAPSPPLPDRTRQHLAEIERLARIGHVRAIEGEIDRMEADHPPSGSLADNLRTRLDRFDLKALATLARTAQHRHDE